MKDNTLIAIIIVAFFIFVTIGLLETSNDITETKKQQLLNCIKTVDGTDAECDSCYYMIYGEFPKNK